MNKLKYNEEEIKQNYLKTNSININYLDKYKFNYKGLKDLRESQEITQKQLSEISGVSIKTIQAIEQNERNIDNSKLETLLNLSIALQCKISDLLKNPELKEKCKQARL